MKDIEDTDFIEDGDGRKVSYDHIRQAMNGVAFAMELAASEGKIVEQAVNAGIDAHLEACFCPHRGDSYQWESGKLRCVVSVESFPTLLRRLYEMEQDECRARLLADVMLRILGLSRPPSTRPGLFPLGALVATPGALEQVPHEERLIALSRHARGDWGDIDPEDRAENELSLREGFRLFSVYYTENKVKFWIITEADRSVTTILLPDEY